MKTLKTLMLLCISLLCLSCSKVTGDPREDSMRMLEEMYAAYNRNDYKEIDNIACEYLKAYKDKDIVDKVTFIKTYSNDLDMEKYSEMIRDDRFQDLPNIVRWDLFEKETKEEGRELGIYP